MDAKDNITQSGVGRASTLTAGLAYAKRGWRVFPCKPGSKTPLIDAWQKRATTDQAQIRDWWERWPGANVGIAAGPGSGLLIADFDGKAGIAWGSRMGLDASDTYAVKTGSGGCICTTATRPTARITATAQAR